MEAYIWLILASMLAVGVLLGFFIGRSKGDTSAPKVRELEASLSKANDEMQNYRTHVTQHFEKTANLFNQLTSDYREVYEHLASSSEQLCGGDQAVKLKSLTAEKKVLEGESQVETPPEEKAEAATAAEPKVEQKAEAEPEETKEAPAEQKVEQAEPVAAAETGEAAETAASAEEEEFVPQPSETAGIEQKAEEARTIH
jgi:uncharacterized membrane-anchored protein YhcB (DUF1043 family)